MFVGAYTDEGISATNTKRRDGFNRMVQDALDGKIDLIVTKSVSRFARNTVDSLTTVRKLKDAGVEVYTDRYNSMVERYENLQVKYDTLQQQKERRQIQAEAVRNCLDALKELELPQLTFTDSLWNTAVDHVTVFADDRLVFYFKNGSEVEVNVCKR